MGNFTDEHLIKAFRLAYYICPDKEIALQIINQALSLLEVNCAAQHKRLYYSLVGRLISNREKVIGRTKVSLESLQRFQWLIYACSEDYERRQEQPCSGIVLTQEDFLIRFIKHLVQLTIARSSFYVALGLSRILYAYTTHEAIGIYHSVLQDPDRIKSEEYFRKQKALLMQEMKARFGSLLQTVHLKRGEERFKAQESCERNVAFAEQCLNKFTLWETQCVLPKRFDSMNTHANALQFQDKDPDNEHPVEIRRMHTLIHPLCFSRLVAALGYASPEGRLVLPMFFHSTGGNPGASGGERDNPPVLEEKDLNNLRNALANQAQRRKRASPYEVVILVDGAEQARLNTRQFQQFQFEVSQDARLLEVKGIDKAGEILLASCIIVHSELRSRDSAKEYSVLLEGGQHISFIFSPSFDSEDEFAGAVVSFKYHQTKHFQRLLLQLLHSWFSQRKLEPRFTLYIKAGLAVLLLIAVIGTSFYLLRGGSYHQISTQDTLNNRNVQFNRPPGQLETQAPKQQESISKTPGAQAETVKPRKKPSSSPLPRQAQVPPSKVDESSLRDNASAEETRSVHPKIQSKDLILIKRVYVQSAQGDSGQLIRDLLLQELQNSKRISTVENPEDADALLLWFLYDKEGDMQFDIRLVRATGKILWADTQRVPSRQYKDYIADIIKQEVRKFLEQIEAMKNK